MTARILVIAERGPNGMEYSISPDPLDMPPEVAVAYLEGAKLAVLMNIGQPTEPPPAGPQPPKRSKLIVEG